MTKAKELIDMFEDDKRIHGARDELKKLADKNKGKTPKQYSDADQKTYVNLRNKIKELKGQQK